MSPTTCVALLLLALLGLVIRPRIKKWIRNRLRASAAQNLRLWGRNSYTQFHVSQLGDGKFLWFKRNFPFQEVIFKSLPPAWGAHVDVWYLNSDDDRLMRTNEGHVFVSASEISGFAQTVFDNRSFNARGAKNDGEFFITYWEVELDDGLLLTLKADQLGALQTVHIDALPNKSIVMRATPGEPWRSRVEVPNEELLDHLRTLFRQLEDEEPTRALNARRSKSSN